MREVQASDRSQTEQQDAPASDGSNAPSRTSAEPLEPDSLAGYIRGFCAANREPLTYLELHLGRLVQTLRLTPPGTGVSRILEMGAYMQVTPALKTKLGYGEVRGCYLGPAGKIEEKTIESSSGESFTCEIDLFDAERDPFPYPDGHFKTVLCCELLEHLSSDPMHLMAEINRVVDRDGYVVLSTPNICSLRSVDAVLNGYHPALFAQYIRPRSGGECDPRHAREYTPRDVAMLLEASGFHVERLETGSYPLERPTDHDHIATILEQLGSPQDLRGDVIHALGRKSGPVADRYPEWLYA